MRAKIMKEKLKKCRGTDKYDIDLMRILLADGKRPFFGELHPELLPYVGQNYEKTSVLLVGESHYVRKADIKQFEETDWYHKSLPDIPSKLDLENPFNKQNSVFWFDTRQVLVRYMNGERGRGHIIFSRPTEVLCGLGIGTNNKYDDFDHFAFMNFFQRPSLEFGESIEYSDEDKQVANDVLNKVIEVLKPKLVVFLFQKAYKAYEPNSFDNIFVEKVSHPTSAWWYKKRKDGKCSRDDFETYLRKILL